MIQLFRVSIPGTTLGLLTSESALLVGCYVLACYWHFGSDSQDYFNVENGIARIAAVALAFVFGAYLMDLYADMRVRSTTLLISRVMTILGAAVVCEAVIGYANSEWALPLTVVITGSTIAIVVLTGWRLLYSGALIAALGSQETLFVGSSRLAFTISDQLRNHPELGFNPMGYLADHPEKVDPLPWLGRPDQIATVVGRTKPDRIVLAPGTDHSTLPINDLLHLRFAGFLVQDATTLYEEAFGRISIDELHPYELLVSMKAAHRGWYVRFQGIYSRLLSLVGLVIAAPILLIAAIAIKLTSRGPVFYRQVRVGLHDRKFNMYKLRSMYQNAEAKTGAVWATRNDPRVTRVGRFLRKSRLDELPQLWNVLRGEMSIIGPRPERPEFVGQLTEAIPYYHQRHCVKPGITGWAQINHKYGSTIEDTRTKLEYDLYYIKNISPSLDAYILFQTIKTMLLTRGAQ